MKFQLRWQVRTTLALLALALSACDAPSATPDAGAPTPDAARPDAGPPPAPFPAAAPLIQWVDPFIGTGGTGFNDIGNMYPGPALPFGMIHPGPDTMNDTGAPLFLHCAGYAYGDAWIRAFSHTRMSGTGITDYGVIALMPFVGAMTSERTGQMGYRARKVRESERASPGYYAVQLEGGPQVELTTGLRASLHRWTFDASESPSFVLPLAHALPEVSVVDAEVTIDPDARELHGHARFAGGYSDRFGGVDVFFVVRADRAFRAHGTFVGSELSAGSTYVHGGTEPSGGVPAADVGAYVEFEPGAAPVHMAVAISFLDVARARASLELEAADLDFDRMRSEAEATWEAELGRVEIEGRYERDFRIFYTALYHAFLMPTLATEPEGAYRGLDGMEHVADGFTYYTDFSLWDTYRTFHPLVGLLDPARALSFVRTLMEMAAQHGSYPRWPLGTGETGGMLGEPAAIVIGDAYERGIRDFDLRRAYDLFAVSGRGNMDEYLARGYVPIESGGSSASKTLEFAYADHSLMRMAEALGESEEAAALAARAQSYRALYDPAVGFLVGRYADGRFVEDLDERRWHSVYAEGNAWQYLWLAPHDPEGLAELLGGRDAFFARLDRFFDESSRERRGIAPPVWYWHGNEPDLHAAYLYAALGDADRSARWSAWARAEHYGDTPTGLAGNDDGGTLSSWYVMSALGLYTLAGQSDWLVGSPLFTRATLHLPGGDVTIEAAEASERALYVQELRWDGAAVDRSRIAHDRLAGGGRLEFVMGPAPAGP